MSGTEEISVTGEKKEGDIIKDIKASPKPVISKQHASEYKKIKSENIKAVPHPENKIKYIRTRKLENGVIKNDVVAIEKKQDGKSKMIFDNRKK